MTGPSLALVLFVVSQRAVTPAPDQRPVDFNYARTVPRLDWSARLDTPRTQGSTDAAESEFFLSWGYNGNGYARSDIHFTQPDLGNDFSLHSVKAHDSKAWTNLFHHALTVPQYDFRFGFFRGKWGFEVALDHIKWIVTQDQQVRLSGTLNGASVDTQITLTEDVLKYQLNNGANPVFFNLLRRVQLAGQPGRTGGTVLLAKAGAGFAMPHTENRVFDQPNEPGFQFFHGWNADVAAAVRINVFRRLYFEFEDKLLYASYHGVNIDHGKARHNVRANEWSWSFGLAFK